MKTNVTRAAAMAASAGFAAMALSVSCTKDRVALPDTDGGAAGSVTVRASIAGYYGDDHSAGAGNAVRDLQACIFEDGRMTGIFDNLSLSGGSCDLAIDGHSGTLYMLANTDGLIDLAALQAEEISETEWLRTTVAMKDGAPADFFSGSVSLDGMDKSQTRIPLSLRRGMARFDLKFNTAGKAEVYRVTLRNAAESVFLFHHIQHRGPRRKKLMAEHFLGLVAGDVGDAGGGHVQVRLLGIEVLQQLGAFLEKHTENHKEGKDGYQSQQSQFGFLVHAHILPFFY